MLERTIVVLEWGYSPKGFFEEEVRLESDEYELVLDDGKATATMDAAVYDADPAIRERLENELEDRFLGAQLVNRKSYKLSRSALYRIHPDGRRDVTVSAHAAAATATADNVDIVIKDADGNVISDSKQERLEKRGRFAELAAKYRRVDATADRMLRSFDASVRDPENELVHLYEIRDALSKKFGGKTGVKEELGISDSKWDRLGRLANAEPIKQGRHRGTHMGVLRDAKDDELNDGRDIARQMIHAYFDYLERSP